MAIVPQHIRDQTPDLSIQMLVQLKDNAKMVLVHSKHNGFLDNVKITESDKELVFKLLRLYYKNADLGPNFKDKPVYPETILNCHYFAGISGSSSNGAFSIIVAGTYSDFDFDQGAKLYYAAADAHTTKAAKADGNNKGNRALLKSFESKKSIRVLRKHTSEWSGAPKAGLRYDGLYTCSAVAERTNKEGGKYLRFRLVRIAGQAPIATDRPTAAEIRDTEAAKDNF